MMELDEREKERKEGRKFLRKGGKGMKKGGKKLGKIGIEEMEELDIERGKEGREKLVDMINKVEGKGVLKGIELIIEDVEEEIEKSRIEGGLEWRKEIDSIIEKLRKELRKVMEIEKMDWGRKEEVNVGRFEGRVGGKREEKIRNKEKKEEKEEINIERDIEEKIGDIGDGEKERKKKEFWFEGVDKEDDWIGVWRGRMKGKMKEMVRMEIWSIGNKEEIGKNEGIREKGWGIVKGIIKDMLVEWENECIDGEKEMEIERMGKEDWIEKLIEDEIKKRKIKRIGIIEKKEIKGIRERMKGLKKWGRSKWRKNKLNEWE